MGEHFRLIGNKRNKKHKKSKQTRTINKKNLHFWAPENLHFIHQQPLHSEKVTVQCALGITRPWFFKRMGPDLLLIWLNSFVCMNVIETRTVTTKNPFTCLVPAGRYNCAHCKRINRFLDACFLDILSRVLAILLDLPVFPTIGVWFFSWGYLKSRVYLDKPQNFDELKTTIIEDITVSWIIQWINMQWIHMACRTGLCIEVINQLH